jgi:hypothetical protein
MDMLILLQTLEIVVWGRGTSMSGSRLERSVVELGKQDAA